MFKKLKVFLGIAALASLSAGLAACSSLTVLEEYQKDNDVMVTFESSGGKFLKGDNVKLVRLFNSEDTMEGDTAQIKLTDPVTDGTNLEPQKSDYAFAGWYRTRIVNTNADGKPIDAQGRVLVEKDGKYYVEGTENEKKPVAVHPDYTFEDYWDFSTDTFNVSKDATAEEKSLTLYAGWVPNYQFNYYFKNNDDWVLYGTTDFDIMAVQEEESKKDANIAYLPDWLEGKMTYLHESGFKFPDLNTYATSSEDESLKDKTFTFKAAYEDKELTKPIDGQIRHSGTFEASTYKIENPVKDIYVDYYDYELYKIDKAEYLIKYPSLSAHYNITEDLDFTGKKDWPSVFSSAEFSGVIEGNGHKIINAYARIDGSEYGGLFASVAAGAEIKNLTFENATVDIVSSPRYEYNYAFFSGNVDENAKISNVTAGGLLKLGSPSVPNTYTINLFAIGSTMGVTNSGVSLQAYGLELSGNSYEYVIIPDQITVDETTGNVTIVAAYSDDRYQEKEYFDIIELWRQNND